MDEEQIKALYRQYWAYMIEKNAEGLRKMMADDYSLLHMTGRRQSAEELPRHLRNVEKIRFLPAA